jgi:hypothetical protein
MLPCSSNVRAGHVNASVCLLVASSHAMCGCLLSTADNELLASEAAMQTQLTKKQAIVAEAQQALSQQSSMLEELMIRKQTVCAGMRQAEDGNVTTVAEQLMLAQRDAGSFETGTRASLCSRVAVAPNCHSIGVSVFVFVFVIFINGVSHARASDPPPLRQVLNSALCCVCFASCQRSVAASFASQICNQL